MSDRVDEFESVFKRASKPRFTYRRPAIKSVFLLSDLEAGQSDLLLGRVQEFLAVLEPDHPRWQTFSDDDYDSIASVLKEIEKHQPDLLITHRNLKQTDKQTPHSLGVYVDTLTQATPVPVLVLPDEPHRQTNMTATSTVMVATDHLTGDNRLINYGVRFTSAGGHIHLCHVEDDAVFNYYLDAVEKIPAINTHVAETGLREQLLKQPADYIRSCITVLREHGLTAHLHAHVLTGHRLQDYRRLLDEHQSELLVLNTKHQDQLAMHGLAYAIAVEFRDIPLLLL